MTTPYFFYVVATYATTIITLIFLFSSRSRHTRCYRDGSSDVCSSDLLARDHGAADLEHPRAGGPRGQDLEHAREIQAGLARHRERFRRRERVDADEQVGHELDEGGMAGRPDVHHARQHRLEDRAPALEEGRFPAADDDAVAAGHHGAGTAHGAVEEAAAACRDLSREPLGEGRGDGAHLDHGRADP